MNKEFGFLTIDQKDEFFLIFLRCVTNKVSHLYGSMNIVNVYDDIDSIPIRSDEHIMRITKSLSTGPLTRLTYRARESEDINKLKTSLEKMHCIGDMTHSDILTYDDDVFDWRIAHRECFDFSLIGKHTFMIIFRMAITPDSKIMSPETIKRIKEMFSWAELDHTHIIKYCIIDAVTSVSKNVCDGNGTSDDKIFLKDMVFGGALYEEKFFEMYPEEIGKEVATFKFPPATI